MKTKLLILLVLISLLLIACSNKNVVEEGNTENIKDLVHYYSIEDIKDETASITSKQLIVTNNDENETIYPLPEDEFFVSFAPFINETHPCTNHSLTGCQGELVNESFDIFIEDEEGNIILDDLLQTEENGFIDLWLPRDKTYNITIDHNGKKVESQFSTYEEDGTCITSFQLM